MEGPEVICIPGPDRAMMYILSAWTGYRRSEIGSLTKRSLRLDDDPPTITVAAAYSKRKRQDTQVLHHDVVTCIREWLEGKQALAADALLFPVSAKVPGGVNRRTAKMMRADLEAARKKWIEAAENARREGPTGAVRLPQVPERLGPVRRLPLQPPYLHHESGARWCLTTEGAVAGPPLRYSSDDGRLHAHWPARPADGDRIAALATGTPTVGEDTTIERTAWRKRSSDESSQRPDPRQSAARRPVGRATRAREIATTGNGEGRTGF